MLSIWLTTLAHGGSPLLEFDKAPDEPAWVTVNDNVMGGRSSGGSTVENGRLIFAGSTDTNGGGFSSVRTQNREWPLDRLRGLRLRVRGDGRTYLLDVRTSDRRLATPFRASFVTQADRWQEVEIPFTDLRPWNFYGPILGPGAPSFDPAAIRAIGLMIYDKQDGPFRLEVDWIRPLEVGASEN
ncbi:MAG: CIA30 family protein [Myxococcota bacterium]